MGLTKSQVANFINDKILFRFSISNDFIINFSEREDIFTFDELEGIINSNFTYWSSINDKAPNSFLSNWQNLKDKFNEVKDYIFNLEELNIDNIKNSRISKRLNGSIRPKTKRRKDFSCAVFRRHSKALKDFRILEPSNNYALFKRDSKSSRIALNSFGRCFPNFG